MYVSTIAQFALLVISVAIIFTFIEPMFGEIKSVQDETTTYEDALAKTAEFNNELNRLSSTLASFRQVDLSRLETYLPDTIDTLSVMADIEAIARRNGVTVNQLASLEPVAPNLDVAFEEESGVPASATSHQDFVVNVTGQYENFKGMLSDLEQNKYLLEVVDLRFGVLSAEAGATVSDTAVPDGTYALMLRAYAYSYVPANTAAPLPVIE